MENIKFYFREDSEQNLCDHGVEHEDHLEYGMPSAITKLIFV